MKRRVFFSVLMIIGMVVISEVRADLVATTWDEFIEDSSLVVVATAHRLELRGDNAGVAQLMVKEVVRGKLRNPKLELTWSAELHDQRIDRLGADYLLFLTGEGSEIRGTHYGRSFWPIESDVDSERVVVYRYPITEVKVPPMFLKDEMVLEAWPESPCECSAKVVVLDKVLAVLRKPQ